MTRKSLRLLFALLALLVVIVTGCAPRQTATPGPVTTAVSPQIASPVLTAPQAAAPQTAATQAAAAATQQKSPVVQYVGKFSLAPGNGPWGTEVTATGTGLPPNTEMQVLWHTVKGSWVLKGKYNDEFHGRRFDEIAVPLTTVRTDAEGNLEAKFTVPEDWGADHDVSVVEVESGIVRNKSNFFVDMEMRFHPASGPPGTPIHIEARGIGHRYMYNSWVLMYDNKLTGWLSSVITGGKATAVIPAAGGPGKHIIKVVHGWSSQAYLNPHQSAEAERPQFIHEFTVTDGPPVLPTPMAKQGLPPKPGSPPPGSGPALWTNPSTGPMDTPVQILARGLPAGEEVDLVWYRMEGSRLEGWTIKEHAYPLGKARVASDGTLAFDFKSPDDLGGLHRIEARLQDKALAEGNFTITPMILAMEPTRGPVGTTIRINLKGTGWTETANIYHLVYDNAYIGYACGFKSLGDIEIFLPATGEPGWHFIDLYPGIYKGKDITGVINFRTPQLTAEEDHPGEELPVLRLAFEVTE